MPHRATQTHLNQARKRRRRLETIREARALAEDLARDLDRAGTQELIREGEMQLREVDAESRRFELSFSSEEPYQRAFYTEILDHKDGAVDLTRLNEIGVLLFNHDRDKVIGKIERAWIENGRGMAAVAFDKDEKSDVIFEKVRTGTLKGVSVGYRVTNWETVEAGSKSADGRFSGPCNIATSWAPFEISIVSVPADASVGVGRSMDNGKQLLAIQERQFQINLNKLL